MAKRNDDILVFAESPESAEAIYKRHNHVLADMVAHLNKKNSTVQYHVNNPTFVQFAFDTATFSLNYPYAFVKCNITSLKRLFLYMVADEHRESYDNKQAIETTTAYIEAFKLIKKEVWRYRSKDYTDNYKCEEYCHSAMLKAVKANNKRLINALKKAKSDYERAEKLEQYFNELKNKYL